MIIINITIKSDHYSAFIGGQFVKLYSDDIDLLQSIGYLFAPSCSC